MGQDQEGSWRKIAQRVIVICLIMLKKLYLVIKWDVWQQHHRSVKEKRKVQLCSHPLDDNR